MALGRLNELRNLIPEAGKILVVDLGFLGDTVQLLPALREIKASFPKAELQVVSAPVGAEVLALAPFVNRAWAVELDRRKRTFGEQWQLVRALRRERFDVAFNFGGADRATILTGLSGARWRVGHASAGRMHFWSRWLIPNWAPRQDPDAPVFEQRRKVLAACGFQLQAPRFDLRIAESLAHWAEGCVAGGAVHVSVNSANPVKEWPLEHYAAMMRTVWERHPESRFVASAGAKEREQERVKSLAALAKDARLSVLPERLSIAQLAAILARCRLHIGPDSGVVHLAVALGVPTISFFRGQGGFKCWLPPAANHRAFVSPCPCGDRPVAPCSESGPGECVVRIEPAAVAEAVCKFIEA